MISDKIIKKFYGYFNMDTQKTQLFRLFFAIFFTQNKDFYILYSDENLESRSDRV